MRRTLLSCTSLARNGLIGTCLAACARRRNRHPRRRTVASQKLVDMLDLNHQEFAVLTTALALLGFSVVAAILLMRTRVRAATEREQAAKRNRRAAGPDRPVARAAVRRAAGADLLGRRRRPAANQRRHLAAVAAGPAADPQRILAFGTWLPPEPALQMDHAVDALREGGEGFLLNLSTSNGRAVEAMGRAIGGQAIVRIRELCGVRRELAEANLRYRTLQEETELLRDFAAAAPWPIWAKTRTASCATPTRPMRRRPRRPASPMPCSAISNCWKATSAAR